MTVEDFKRGQCCISVCELEDFRTFREWASEWGLTWRNGAGAMAEDLVENNQGDFLNSEGTVRYHRRRSNCYRARDGKISLCNCRGLTRYYVDSLAFKHEISSDGFEEEL